MFLYIMAVLYVIAGAMHFIRPHFYRAIVPPFLPNPERLVAISGAIEIILGVLLLFPSTRSIAAWGVILLLIAVFPANIYMAYSPQFQDLSPLIRWGRLPIQFLLIAWAYQYTH
jgi:uncharacterized membrane protein